MSARVGRPGAAGGPERAGAGAAAQEGRSLLCPRAPASPGRAPGAGGVDRGKALGELTGRVPRPLHLSN